VYRAKGVQFIFVCSSYCLKKKIMVTTAAQQEIQQMEAQQMS
jgi:hypothetical protein